MKALLFFLTLFSLSAFGNVDQKLALEIDSIRLTKDSRNFIPFSVNFGKNINWSVYISLELCTNIAEVGEIEIICSNIGYTENTKAESGREVYFPYGSTQLEVPLEKIKKIALRHRSRRKKKAYFDVSAHSIEINLMRSDYLADNVLSNSRVGTLILSEGEINFDSGTNSKWFFTKAGYNQDQHTASGDISIK